VYEVEKGLTSASIRAVFTFSLYGMMCPPMLIYTHKFFKEIVVNKFVTELNKTEGRIRQNLPSGDRLML